MHIEHIILAQKSAIDFEKNTVSVFELVEDLNVQTSEATTPTILFLNFLVIVKRDASEFGPLNSEVVIEVKKSDEKNTTQRIPVAMDVAHKRNRLRIDLQLELVPGEGSHDYQFSAYMSDRPETYRSIISTISRIVDSKAK